MASHVPRKVVTVLKAEVLNADEDTYPTVEEFKVLWTSLSKESQRAVKCGLDHVYYKEASAAAKMHYNKLRKILTKPDVMRTYYYGKLLRLSSDTARKTFIKSLVSDSAARTLYEADVDKIVMTDKNHLQEIVKNLSFDGDGKRDQLKLISAYGQQVKLVEHAIIDDKTGKELAPAIVSMADPRIAMTALQELNKMDHEYGDDKKATSSIETHADRIKRLRLFGDKVERSAKKAAKKLELTKAGIVQKELSQDEAARELKGIESEHVKGDV